MTEPTLPPIYLRANADEVPSDRFKGDLYARDKLATQLTGFITRMPDGGVIAIDSPWGEGKTWFGRRWCASLQDAGFPTAYIDCFQRDHIEDPFSMIAGELIELSRIGESKVRTKLLASGKSLGAALLPAATKLAVNAVGHWATGATNLADDIVKGIEAVNASAADALEKLVESQLADYQKSKKGIESFKKALAELATESEKPIVIFLDELDRCRPDFAVRTIERVKHFFEAPRVIFVLLLNRSQLAAAVEGLYGPKIDSDAYLSKFIPISLTLPKRVSVEKLNQDDNQKHCRAELERLGFSLTEATDGFATAMGLLATLFSFSLRDVERAVVLYSFAQPLGKTAFVAAWPIALKLKRPDLYRRLCSHDSAAHREARELASKLKSIAPEADWPLDFVEELHKSGESKFIDGVNEYARQQLLQSGRFRSPEHYLTWLFSRFDLKISE